MLRLTQNITNTRFLTLSESITLSGQPVYFLFRFISDTTNEEVLFTGPDLSTNTTRYNQFNITLTGSTFQDLTGGTISLNPLGSFKYEVYEMYSPTNLALSGTSGVILENGIVQLSGTGLSLINQSYSGASNSYNYYIPS